MGASVSVQSAASPEVDEFQTLLYGADPTPGVVAVEAAAPAHRILLAAACDNQGGEWLLQDEDEGRLIAALVELIRQRDPDTLEGHNLFAFDLPFLMARASRAGVSLALGRDGSELRLGRERRCAIGANSRPIRPPVVWGRHCLDTLLGVQ